ncbi:hypothetical protein ACFOD4_19625, partial [Pseudoroseomonas globiformis]
MTSFSRHRRGACGCGGPGSAEESAGQGWTELEAWPLPPTAQAPPAFLADSEDWAPVYKAGTTYQDGVRILLGPEGETLTDQEIDVLLDRMIDGLSPAEAEDFFGSIGRAVQSVLPAVGQVAQAALPVAGAALGSIVAPGLGTALGGALGGMAGKLAGQAAGGAARPRPPQARPA